MLSAPKVLGEVLLADFKNLSDFEAWLQGKLPKVAVALAARAALRVLPAVRMQKHKGFSRLLALPVFRASAVSWAAAKYSAQENELARAAATAAFATSVAPVVDARAPGADIAFEAAIAAAHAAAPAADTAFDTAFEAARAAARAAAAAAIIALAAERTAGVAKHGASPGYAAAEAACWSAVSIDATRIEKGTTTSDIVGSLLWPDGQPDGLQSLWPEMKSALLSAGQDWKVWTDWYDDRLEGRVGDEERELAYVRIENDLWNQGPAIVNAEIKKRIEERAPDTSRGPEQGPHLSLPAPIENVRSAVSFRWTQQATITLISGPENWPVFPYKGGEQDHKNRLEACRALATDTVRFLQSGRWNARPDYAEILDQYVAYLPVQPEEGNFLLADAEARVIRAMFAGDADILPVPLAAQLKVFLEQHMGLRAYYPTTEDFYESVRSGHLEAPLPIDAVENFIQVVRDNTPTLFEPNVSQSLDRIAQPVPTISPIDAEVPGFNPNSAQPMPPPDPLGPLDPIQEWRFVVASGANALWKVVKFGPVAYAGVEGWSKIIETLGPHAAPIIAWLRGYLGM